MKIKGTPIADSILNSIKEEILQKHLHPHLVILDAGEDPNSKAYIKHKKDSAEKVGIKATQINFAPDEEQKCLETIKNLNADQTVHGMIAQLPLYKGWDTLKFINSISDEKDIDGFKENSHFLGATALGVWEMLGAFAREEGFSTTEEFLKGKKIVVVGKGITAGRTSIILLRKKGFEPIIIDSKTSNPDQILQTADVIISATGRKHIIHAGNIKQGSYVIGIGVGREVVDGQVKVFGDINPNIEEKARLYCPTIGGIGPLTIACLLRNVLEAAKKIQ